MPGKATEEEKEPTGNPPVGTQLPQQQAPAQQPATLGDLQPIVGNAAVGSLLGRGPGQPLLTAGPPVPLLGYPPRPTAKYLEQHTGVVHDAPNAQPNVLYLEPRTGVARDAPEPLPAVFYAGYRGEGSTVYSTPLQEKAWVAGASATLYRNDTDDTVLLILPRYTRLTILARAQTGVGRGRFRVQVGKPADATQSRVNYGSFERQHLGTQGWLAPRELTETFPVQGNFPIPRIGKQLPPLYHGTTADAVEKIKKTGFQLTTTVVGRSLGDGIYAAPSVSGAAVHAFGVAGISKTSPKFAVGRIVPGPNLRGRKPKIFVHDRLAVDKLYDTMQEGGPAERVYRVIAKLYGESFAAAAAKLAPKLPNLRKQAPQPPAPQPPGTVLSRLSGVFRREGGAPVPGTLPITAHEITAAARAAGYDAVAYTGEPGDTTYVLVNPADWIIDRTVLEGEAGAEESLTRDVSDLDFYHQASELDRYQGLQNAT